MEEGIISIISEQWHRTEQLEDVLPLQPAKPT